MDHAEPTINTTEDSDDGLGPVNTGLDQPTPRMILLHHSDLSRVGSITAPDLMSQGQWVQLGRYSPEFISLNPLQGASALQDPRISRLQAEIRWRPARGVFEISPNPQARRPVSQVIFNPNGGSPRTLPIESPTTVPPGTLLTVGKRALILLDLRAWHAPSQDRMGMIGETEQMWHLRREIESVARFEGSVLVLGETGVGKELVAGAIHNRSPRSQDRFIPVNCAALPEHLVESMLFGHKKGAFTGATQDQMGVFEEANNGCLFLDELGELPMGIQAKLLRVTQDGMLTPVGSTRHKPVNVRLIAATNRSPFAEINAGNLREDLYYRIASHTINVPNLRARRWDVPLLFVQALDKLRQTHPELGWLWQRPEAPRPAIPIKFILALLSHTWEGNIRELLNIAAQTARLNLSSGTFNYPNVLTRRAPSLEDRSIADLRPPASIDDATLRKAARHFSVSRNTLDRLLQVRACAPPRPDEPFSHYLTRLEAHLTETLADLLAQANHSQVQLAAELNVSRSTLIKLILNLKITRPGDLSEQDIQNAAKTTGGDVEAMATILKVSSRALKLHLSRNNLMHLIDS